LPTPVIEYVVFTVEVDAVSGFFIVIKLETVPWLPSATVEGCAKTDNEAVIMNTKTKSTEIIVFFITVTSARKFHHSSYTLYTTNVTIQ
jgi:hypothetical protein